MENNLSIILKEGKKLHKKLSELSGDESINPILESFKKALEILERAIENSTN